MRCTRLLGAITIVTLAAGLLVPGSASAAAPPVPTNVRLAWADDAHRYFRVTWDDDGSANLLRSYLADGSRDSVRMGDKNVPASGRNLAILPARYLRTDQAVRIGVFAVDGDTLSAPAYSALVLGSDLVRENSDRDDPAPTAVRVGWADDQHRALRVTWSDGGQGNQVVGMLPDGRTTSAIHPVTASEPNELVVPAGTLTGRDLASMSVAVFTAAVYDPASWQSVATSLPASSDSFDTRVSPVVVIDDLRALNGERISVSWHRAAVEPDDTPDDVLDLLSDPDLMTPWIDNQPVAVPPGTTSYEVARQPDGYRLSVYTTNEWGRNGTTVDVGPLILHSYIPTVGWFGQAMHPEVVVEQSTGPLSHWPVAPAVVLQARRSGSDPWVAVATLPAGTVPLRLPVTSWGTRQYRFVVPTTVVRAYGAPEDRPYEGAKVLFGRTGGVFTSATRYSVRSARFSNEIPVAGNKVTATLRVLPATSVRATLQHWNGSSWVSDKWVYLKNGTGSYTFTTTRRGQATYRFVLPATTYNGWRIASTATGELPLTVQ